MTLDLFFEDEVKPFTEGHVNALIQSWKKFDKSDKLYNFNHDWYVKYFEKCSNKQLMYYAGLGIPHYSEWASIVALSRGII